MKKLAGWKAISMNLVVVVSFSAAAPAMAQLEIGGQPFEGGDSAPATEGDELTQRVQRDLAALGYEPGSTSGEMNVDTAVAISRFQAENGLDVTGEVSPQLAGILAARVSAIRSGNSPGEASASTAGASVDAAPAPAGTNCVPAAAEESSDARRGAGRLARAGGRLFSRFGGDDARRQVVDATQTASDVAEIADVVDDLTECEPGG